MNNGSDLRGQNKERGYQSAIYEKTARNIINAAHTNNFAFK
jgi:hypothetical protein